ncbi:MAG: oligosaccharide flippase family protein [Candidatus Marinimicrobia bacterium]|nr:oligosaccharide flippase family protein [Candidatus Neomarinimicrobiota bacterium]
MSIRALGKQSLIYGFGHIISRIITFLLLPLYTNIFTPTEYGVISLAYAFIGFALMLYRYGTDTALMKFYSQTENDKSTYFTTILIMQILSGIAFSGFLILFSNYLSPILLGTHDSLILILIAGILLFDTLWTLAAIVLRSEEKPFSFVGLNLINVVGTLVLNIFFVLTLKYGIRGVLFSNLIVSFFLVLILAPFFFKRFSFSTISTEILKKVFWFALPFLPAGIFTMVLELSNRYFLKWLTDTATVGIYSAGYKLGMFGLLMVMGFNMGWTPYFLKQRDNPDAKPLFARVAKYFLGLQGFVSIVLILWIDTIIRSSLFGISFFGPGFWSSTQIMPLILLGYMFFAIYVLQHPAIYHTDNTKWVAMFRGVSALVAIILNLVLIPYWGIMGSAWASVIAYASMALSIYLKTRKIYPIPYSLIGVIFPFLCVIVVMVIPASLLVKLLIPFIYLVVWTMFVLTADERKSIKQMVLR